MGKCILINKDGEETFQSDGSAVTYKKGKVTEDKGPCNLQAFSINGFKLAIHVK